MKKIATSPPVRYFPLLTLINQSKLQYSATFTPFGGRGGLELPAAGPLPPGLYIYE